MCIIQRDTAAKMLNALKYQHFQYGYKSPNMDLYDLGFGEDIVFIDDFGKVHEANKYAIHHTCNIRIALPNEQIYEYTAASNHKDFFKNIQPLIGEQVHRVILSNKNEICLYIGKHKLSIVPHHHSSEQWRFFLPGSNEYHLVLRGNTFHLE